MGLKKHYHMVYECIPLPKEVGDMAPIYFKVIISRFSIHSLFFLLHLFLEDILVIMFLYISITNFILKSEVKHKIVQEYFYIKNFETF
jgi:hypothetical protein